MFAAEPLEPRELARLWNAVLGRLELELNPHNFNTWLRGTHVLRFEGTRLVVEARTSFNCDWLNQRLITVVQRAAGHVFGSDLSVLFVPDGMLAALALPAASDQAMGALSVPTVSILGTLNRSYRFESYLAAEGNRLAYESCLAIVEPMDFSVSPVVIFGAPGVGKTHLLHALAHRAAAAGWPVACLSAEEFTTRYMTALRHKDVEPFQTTFRLVKLLVIDDLQYVAGKRATQDELVHTIDAVVNGGGYVVCASELHPLDIDLPDRLASRLAAGIVTRVEPFCAGERKTFIEQLARERRTSLPAWAADRIAGCEVPSARVLQGAVHAAIALQQRGLLDMRRLDAELTRISMSAVCPGAFEDRVLLDVVARYFETTFDELVGRSRKLPVGQARAVAIAALKERGRTLSGIARTLGDRHPSTISELVDRGQQIIATDATLRSALAG
jgi:chromosomal replication initiator protein